jgi:hypothetical protein
VGDVDIKSWRLTLKKCTNESRTFGRKIVGNRIGELGNDMLPFPAAHKMAKGIEAHFDGPILRRPAADTICSYARNHCVRSSSSHSVIAIPPQSPKPNGAEVCQEIMLQGDGMLVGEIRTSFQKAGESACLAFQSACSIACRRAKTLAPFHYTIIPV